MGMTIAEKIIASHSGRDEVKPGEVVTARLDLIMGTDIATPLAIKVFREMDASSVWDPERIALVNDHFVPAKDVKAADFCRTLREFAREHNIKNYFEVGKSGISHVLLPEKGLVLPGDLVIGADSHTCTFGALGAFATGVGSTDMASGCALGEIWLKVPETIRISYEGTLRMWVGGKDLVLYTLGKLGVRGALYKCIEYTGDVISGLPMADRFAMTNMAIEMGAKTGIIETDTVTENWLKGRTDRSFELVKNDADANFLEEIRIDCSQIEPMVALPHIPSKVKPVSDVKGIRIDEVFIGSCTNGRIEDLKIAADIIKGKKVAEGTRLLVIPASQEVMIEMTRDGLTEIFLEAGAAVCTPTCGPCIGGHMGVLGKNEVGLFTSNRNFVGRCGDPTSEVYLSGPQVAAASSVTGYITHPDEL
ncbi:MAG: 3-isopropylmalate dehydratase large subunit [Candidatus Glassbacteria bacterium]